MIHDVDRCRRPTCSPGAQDRQERSAGASLWRIALTLGALVLLFYVVTIAKLGPNVLQRPM